jgi:hypothetical protein
MAPISTLISFWSPIGFLAPMGSYPHASSFIQFSLSPLDAGPVFIEVR